MPNPGQKATKAEEVSKPCLSIAKKSARLVAASFLGEKNGNAIGSTFAIVVRLAKTKNRVLATRILKELFWNLARRGGWTKKRPVVLPRLPTAYILTIGAHKWNGLGKLHDG